MVDEFKDDRNLIENIENEASILIHSINFIPCVRMPRKLEPFLSLVTRVFEN